MSMSLISRTLVAGKFMLSLCISSLLLTLRCSYKAGTFPGPLGGLKTAVTRSGDVNFVVHGQSTADGKVYNPETAPKHLSTARIYDSVWVRHWDTWLTTEFNAVFSGKMKKGGNQYKIDGELKNLVAPVTGAESPYPPFGGTDHYDLSPDGQTVAWMSKAPELPKANLTSTYIFVGPHDGSSEFAPINKRGSSAIPQDVKGASTAPKFSPDSKQLAYLQMKGENYESDRNIIYVAKLGSSPSIKTVAEKWDRSPSTVQWTPNGRALYVAAEDRGTTRLFSVPVDAGPNHRPRRIQNVGSVSGFSFLGRTDRVLVTATSLWSNALYYISNPLGAPRKVFFANEHDAELKGLGPEDVDEFYWKGKKHSVSSLVKDMYQKMPANSPPSVAASVDCQARELRQEQEISSCFPHSWRSPGLMERRLELQMEPQGLG